MITLHALTDGPPSVAVRILLEHLKVPYVFRYVKYYEGETLTDDFWKLNPQREIPVIDDNGFLLSEHVAIMQYICDKYAPKSSLYPVEARHRAIVNQRLCFNTSFFYSAIAAAIVAPIFFDYPQTEQGIKRVHNVLGVFEEYMKRLGKKYVAGDTVTIADISLACSSTVLEAARFDLSLYPLVKKWYETFKNENKEMWIYAQKALDEVANYAVSPPDMSKMVHPIHPMKKK
ncbi:CLUMA_CG004112, isoform A [Clunio marinus]|uniref:glutathione transferase n=1 Tax=Clunio marinus TaxID=568069 RepID=A0A1J1HR02_9DIPT|nr:CLUMA_CG004112, isoform A [Clunio marinus]